mmetsp:Transcript_40268/g.108000  ORF Transcript_40268/g.108000 Transcript_40268/m.108000 type:complete len:124 (+) Transcript_40268:92-463(+)
MRQLIFLTANSIQHNKTLQFSRSQKWSRNLNPWLWSFVLLLVLALLALLATFLSFLFLLATHHILSNVGARTRERIYTTCIRAVLGHPQCTLNNIDWTHYPSPSKRALNLPCDSMRMQCESIK